MPRRATFRNCIGLLAYRALGAAGRGLLEPFPEGDASMRTGDERKETCWPRQESNDSRCR
jgi:hypothetical protein